MDLFIARQPIFNHEFETVAYSLLYRDSSNNVAPTGGDEATASVIVNGPLMLGLETLTDNKKAFIKFTETLLLNETATILLPEATVVDIVESVEYEKLLIAIKKLKGLGYTIAIDSKHNFESLPELIEQIDIIKIDFSTNGVRGIQNILVSYANKDVTLMAIKVETREQYEFAISFGFKLFQGNFFKKPTMITSKDVKCFKNSHLMLMKELYTPNPNFVKISEVIEKDLGLSYKVLRLVNSSAYAGKKKITDIQQAIVRLGLKELYKWFGLIVLREFCDDKPPIYARTSVIRGKALENLASKLNHNDIKEELFLTGMFSMIDVILERPMDQILSELPLSDDVIKALSGEENLLRKGLDIMTAYEEGDWESIFSTAAYNDESLKQSIYQCYYDAIQWSKELF